MSHSELTAAQIQMLSVKQMDLSEIDNIEIDGIDFADYPDFCDAYIASADYMGIAMTEDQLDELNSGNFNDFVYESVCEKLF